MTPTLCIALLFLAGCISAPSWIDRLMFAVSVCLCVGAATWMAQPAKTAPVAMKPEYRRVTNAIDDYIAAHVHAKQIGRLIDDFDRPSEP